MASDAWSSVGTLKSLRLSTGRLDADCWAFVERFAGTLETLNLECEDFCTDHPPQLAASFPQLTSLSLHTTYGTATSLLSFLPPSPLTFLELDLAGEGGVDNSPFPIAPALEGLPTTLRQLRYTSADCITIGEGETRWLRGFCERRRIVLACAGEWTAPYSSTILFIPGLTQGIVFKSICSSLEDILAFAVDRVAVARRGGDLGGLKELVEHTNGLKSLQEVWRD